MSRGLRIIGTPARLFLLGIVRLYRVSLGRLLPPRCRFHPSCSAYAEEALVAHGAAKGAVLAAWRVLRCNPLSAGGVDPVPDPRRSRSGDRRVTPSYNPSHEGAS